MTGPWVDGDLLTSANLNSKFGGSALSNMGFSTNTLIPQSGSTIQVLSALSVTGPLLVGGVTIGDTANAGALWRPAFSTNHYYMLPPWAHGLFTASFVIGHDMFAPFLLSKTVTIDRLAFRVTGGGGAGSKARAGLYNANLTTLKPTTLIVDGGEFDTSAAGLSSATVNVTLNKSTPYFFAYNCGSVTPTINSLGIAGTTFDVTPQMGIVWDLLPSNNFQFGWDLTRSYGAFLADVSAQSFAVANQAPMGFVRLSAVV